MNWRFNENDIAFGIVGIDEIERIHRELAYACAELGANRFERRFRANITDGFNCVEDVEDLSFNICGRYPCEVARESIGIEQLSHAACVSARLRQGGRLSMNRGALARNPPAIPSAPRPCALRRARVFIEPYGVHQYNKGPVNLGPCMARGRDCAWEKIISLPRRPLPCSRQLRRRFLSTRGMRGKAFFMHVGHVDASLSLFRFDLFPLWVQNDSNN